MKVIVRGNHAGTEAVFEGHPALVARQLLVRFRWLRPNKLRPSVEWVVEQIRSRRGYAVYSFSSWVLVVNGRAACEHAGLTRLVGCSSESLDEVTRWADLVRKEAPGALVELVDGECAHCKKQEEVG